MTEHVRRPEEDYDLLTIATVAAKMGVHKATVYREIAAGRLAATSVPGGSRISRAEYRRYVAAQTKSAQSMAS